MLRSGLRCVVVALTALAAAASARADVVTILKPNPQLERAIALLKTGDLKAADAAFARIHEGDPSFPQALLGRAQVAVTQKNAADAERTVRAVLATQPAMPEAHNMLGVVLVTQNRNADARAAFRRAIELRPAYVTPYVYLAAIARAANDLAAAAAEYKRVTAVAPRLATGYLGQAEALFMLRRDNEAFAALEAWKKADPRSPLPMHVLCNVHLGRREPQKAIQILSASAKQFPQDAPTQVLLGDAHLALGDRTTAAKHYEKGATGEPANLDALLKLGVLKAQSGNADGAILAFRQILAKDPGHVGASNNLAWLIAEGKGDLNEALRLARAATKAAPAYVDAQDTLGWVYYRRGEYATAVTTLEAARKVAPERSDIAAHLGFAYAKAGKAREALAELRRAISSPQDLPNRAEAQRLADRLDAELR